MSNPLHPDAMTPRERVAELAAILAGGVIRVSSGKSSRNPNSAGEFSLDCRANQSGHAPETNTGGTQ